MAPKTPFDKGFALDKQLLKSATSTTQTETIDHVPDQPSVGLRQSDVCSFLEAELATGVLDKMYDWLWLCAAKDSTRIDSLHEHVLKGRTVLPSEDPALHMVWFNNNVCIKPMPPALTNCDFWDRYLRNPSPEEKARECEDIFDRKVALGFLRSYGRLIRHRSDLNIALEKGLVPKGVHWRQWENFIKEARKLDDHEVAKRYHFGQIRLNRLNMLIRFVRPGKKDYRGNNRHYFTMHWNTASYLRQFVEAGLFVFASVSLLLSAMQVILSLPQEPEVRTWNRNSNALSFAFWGFCVMVLVILALSWLLLLGGPILYMGAQQVYGWRKKRSFDRRRWAKETEKEDV